MSVPQAVLLAVLAAVVGLAVGGLLIPYMNARQAARRQADSGLTMSQVLDLIVLASESGIAVVDEYRDVVLVNPRAEELGLVRHRLLDERAWVAVEKVLATGESTEFDLTAKNPVPGRGRIAVRGVARQLSREETTFTVLFADDDSEQARMEATRRDFVANVSHELKTPVGAMSLLAEALLESAEDPEAVRHFGQRVLGESRRLGKMVTELIALSRLQGAEKLPELEVVDVDTVVMHAVDRSRTAAEAAGITVSTDRPSGLEVLGDETLLVTALSNLVENAIAYSPAGSHVSVSRCCAATTSPWPSPTAGSASPRKIRSGCSNGSSGPTRHALARPAAPGSDWLSSSMWPPTTMVRSPCGASWARDRRSPCASPLTTKQAGTKTPTAPW